MEYRMYGLVPYNISQIQKAIQYGHAVVEYGLEYFHDEEYQNWAKNHKTFIILDGGTSNHQSGSNRGSMEKNLIELRENGIKTAGFNEPDLNDMLSGIAFLVDERVYDIKKYPDFIFSISTSNIFDPYIEEGVEFSHYCEWVRMIGGDENLFLRKFLRNLKLA